MTRVRKFLVGAALAALAVLPSTALAGTANCTAAIPNNPGVYYLCLTTGSDANFASMKGTHSWSHFYWYALGYDALGSQVWSSVPGGIVNTSGTTWTPALPGWSLPANVRWIRYYVMNVSGSTDQMVGLTP